MDDELRRNISYFKVPNLFPSQNQSSLDIINESNDLNPTNPNANNRDYLQTESKKRKRR